MRKFKTPDRHQLTLLPPSIEDWLPEEHLARFVVDVVNELDMSEIYESYGHTGSTPYDPSMLLALLFYGYATGVYSSRKIEAATWDSVAFRYISGNLHPDHDTIAYFRKRFLAQIERYFVEILLIGKSMDLVQVGKVSIDGTKVQANASKHSAMSYAYMNRLEQQLHEEVARLLELAEEADANEAGQLDIPEELKRRETRIKRIREAKKELEKRAKERYEEEKAAYERKMKERGEKQKATGKKPGGRPPQPPIDSGPRDKDQYNFTDPESRIMRKGGGFEQCYNAQAAVTGDMLIIGAYANNHPNDKAELLPLIETIPEKELGKPEAIMADAGYYSDRNVTECEKKKIDVYLAAGRYQHNRFLEDHLESPEPPSEDLPTIDRMRKKLRTPVGRATYRLRKMTVEPVFGIIKEIIGFRRFSLRGEAQANSEWLIVCTAYNLKRMFNISLQKSEKPAV